MRVHCPVVVICCAFAVGCGGSSVERPAAERPATASIAPPAAAPATDTLKSPKRVVASAIATSMEIGSTDGAFDVESLNPVKMDRSATTGGKFNPFAK